MNATRPPHKSEMWTTAILIAIIGILLFGFLKNAYSAALLATFIVFIGNLAYWHYRGHSYSEVYQNEGGSR